MGHLDDGFRIAMRNYFPDDNPVRGRAMKKRGRAVLVGYGTDAPDGHVRYTRAGGAELYGGSDEAHTRMRERALRIQRELDALGILLDDMTYEQYQVARRIVDAANHE